jgi:hypothetical protein
VVLRREVKKERECVKQAKNRPYKSGRDVTAVLRSKELWKKEKKMDGLAWVACE